MNCAELYKICSSFRWAIEKVRNSNKFHHRDRMSGFPIGCCDDACDLLGYYLEHEYGIITKQLVKIVNPNSIERTYHSVLILDNGIIIDITGDQLGLSPVYVGEENNFYKPMGFSKVDYNYNIEEHPNLWNDYNLILEEIE